MMILCNSHVIPLDSRVRGNDGSAARRIPVINVINVIPGISVIPAHAGIHANNRGIRPESLPPAEDVKKVERRLASAERKVLKNPESLEDGE